MYSSDIRGGSSVAARLDSGKLFQAYIISGQSSGKMELAKYIAAKAVCSGIGGHAPCGECADCRKAKDAIHPDIIFVEPSMGEKENRAYLIKEIRKICADSAVVPNDAQRKVYIITDASKLSAACQDVLLKTLEEPPSHAVFILVAENSGNLLATVRSRCVELYITAEKHAEICSEEVRKLASGFMDAVASNDRVELAEYLLSLEGISRSDAAELVEEMLRCCATAARDNAFGKNCGIPTEKLLRMTSVFEEIRNYFKFNVSAGHAIGLLMAELL